MPAEPIAAPARNSRPLAPATTDRPDAYHLKGLTNLKYLDLDGNTQITDAGLEHLKGMTSLRGVELMRTSVTDEGVKRLQEALPDCEIIHG